MTEFERRRAAFSKAIGDAVAVFPSAPVATRSNDTTYPYQQDADFYYLSGFTEPHSVIVIAPNADAKSVIFVQPKNREREIWEGWRMGVERAAQELGFDAAYPIGELDERLPKLLDTADDLYYGLGGGDAFERRIREHVRSARIARRRADRAAINLLDPSAILHEMRIIKSPADIAGLRRAVEISAAGHLAAMRHSRSGMHEYEVQAIVEYTFKSRGAQSLAYESIVAGGANAVVLHYASNRQRVPDNALVLVDAGAQVDYYNGDITRTWPISGAFTPEQRAVYDIVLAAQKAALALCKPGNKLNSDVNDAAQRVMVDGLRELGLVTGSAEAIIESGAHKPFLPHRIGHFLGLDTHDVGWYRSGGDWRPLAPGMVVTIEPGLYIAEDLGADRRLAGIGVRIEDDVLITDSGYEILGDGLPKDAAHIERTIAEGRESKEPLFA